MVTSMPFARLVTLSAAAFSGFILLATAARGFAVIPTHLALGDPRSAVFVGVIAALLFGLSLVFLMPGIGGRVLRGGRASLGPSVMRTAAFMVLCCFLILLLLVSLAAQGPILGFFPLEWLPLAIVLFILVFTAAYILPGVAYRASAAPGRREPAAQSISPVPARTMPQPAPQPVPQPDAPPTPAAAAHAPTWPRLKPGPVLKLFLHLTLVLAAAALWAINSADVVPTVEGMDRVEGPARLAFLAVTAPLLVMVASSPMSHGATLARRLVVKTFAIVVLTVIGGIWGMALPQRIAPYVAEALHGSDQGARRYTVLSFGTDKNSRDTCDSHVEVALDGATDRSFEVCRIPRDLIDRLEPGKDIEFVGRITDYGMIWTEARLPAGG